MSSHTAPPPDLAAEPTVALRGPVERPYSGPAPAGLRLPKRAKKHLTVYPVTALVLALGAAGCGDATSASPVATVPTVTITQIVAAPPTAATVTQTVLETVTPAAPAPADSSDVAPPKAAGRIIVPDGVGMNYQEAQDAWRAAGLHVAPAKDATGANRLPVLDSNWIVLSQDPEPGTKVAADSFIIATIQKKDDN